MRNYLWAACLMLSIGGFVGGVSTTQAGGPACDPVATSTCERRPIDLVICLDTSGSMEALIDSARARLWDIVNSLSSAKPTPELRVGLITYGSPNRSTASQGWVVLQSGLTTDLDSVYARMMEFRTDGGDEFVGWALNEAVTKMNWSNNPKALKLIFVAGNESADQARDVFDFRSVGSIARSRGIIINAIYAGDRNAGANERWAEVASCGGGTYASIDMRCGTVQIEAPQDKILLELNMKLNATYVPYGDAGREGAANQMAQDANAERLGQQSAVSRAAAKASGLYRNERWDLVDAVAKGEKKVKDMKEADLPAPMQTMNDAERERFVQRMQAERVELQKKIAEVGAEREKYVRAKRTVSADGKTALDDAMLAAIREQAKSQGFEFKE
jgi:hypothetical protein